MKLQQNLDIQDFLRSVDTCSGDVYFKTKEHDCLNLKSTLTRFVFTTFLESPDLLYESEVECTDRDDYQRLADFLH